MTEEWKNRFLGATMIFVAAIFLFMMFEIIRQGGAIIPRIQKLDRGLEEIINLQVDLSDFMLNHQHEGIYALPVYKHR